MPRETVPTKRLKVKAVWEALLHQMPMTALIRRHGNMTAYGLLTGSSKATSAVIRRLISLESLCAARIHPIQVLNALRVYAGGRRLKGRTPHLVVGQQDWTPFHRSLLPLTMHIDWRLALLSRRTGGSCSFDISASMTWGHISGMHLTPREASAALALVTASVEDNCVVTGSTRGMMTLDITGRMRLQDAFSYIDGLRFGGRDGSLPMLDAAKRGLPIDTIIIYADSETWADDIHPIEALKRYREKSGIPAKLITVGMTSTLTLSYRPTISPNGSRTLRGEVPTSLSATAGGRTRTTFTMIRTISLQDYTARYAR